jgi:hypothetical protein
LLKAEGSFTRLGGQATFMMTAVFYCHPEGFSPKDPLQTNKRLSLLWMGSFTAFRMTLKKSGGEIFLEFCRHFLPYKYKKFGFLLFDFLF